MRTSDVVKFFGSKTRIAFLLGMSKQAVSDWGETVPRGRAFELHVLSEGALSHPKFAKAS
jgi:hypothetical protein